MKFVYQRVLLVLVASVVLAGCASNKSLILVKNYAQQSQEVEEALLKEYEKTQEARIDAMLAQASREGISSNNLVVQRINNQGQVALLQNLLSFSQSVYILSSDNYDDELNSYSEQLNSSLSSISELSSNQASENSKIELVSTAINALARARTERARYQNLKEILIGSHDLIQSSFQSLSNELESWEMISKVSMEKELRTRLYLLNNPDRCELNNIARCATLSHSLEERIEAYRKAYTLKSKISALSVKFENLRSSLKAVQNLNSVLVKSLSQDGEFSKESLTSAFEITKAQLKKLKEFQNTL
ncbi:hypothetical protein ACJ3XJ_10165 [Marinomonas sp. RS-M-Aa-14]